MGIAPLRSALALAPLAALVFQGPAAAQEQMKAVPGFDPGRAILHDTWGFDPFRPTNFESLADALAARKVVEDTPLLVLTRGDTRLALLTTQMSYHHVAQGELAGEPWMVSF